MRLKVQRINGRQAEQRAKKKFVFEKYVNLC